jgi:hypothetical protein
LVGKLGNGFIWYVNVAIYAINNTLGGVYLRQAFNLCTWLNACYLLKTVCSFSGLSLLLLTAKHRKYPKYNADNNQHRYNAYYGTCLKNAGYYRTTAHGNHHQ